jgi:hypothetical protein
VDETFRMLGREHQADLEREAAKRSLADRARSGTRNPVAMHPTQRRLRHLFRLFPARKAGCAPFGSTPDDVSS